MNSVQLVGRLTKDVDVYNANSGAGIARFTLAVDRRFKKDGQPDADFIPCIAFGQTGEYIEKYFHKGNRIGITGRIQTGSYEKDGVRVYTTDIVVENWEFVESKKAAESAPAPGEPSFMDIPDIPDEELPFK